MAKRKKKTNEETFDVEVIQKDGGFSSSDDYDNIEAENPSDAVKKISDQKQIDIKNTDGVKVTTNSNSRKEPRTRPEVEPRTKPRGLSETAKKKLHGLDIERYQYPYSIILPIGFKDLLEKVASDTKLTTIIRFGQISLDVPNASSMKRVSESLAKKRDAKATVILTGIKQS